VVKNNQLFFWKQSTGVLGDPCDFVNFLNFNKDNRINEHNLIQGIPDFGSVNDTNEIGFEYKIFLNYKSKFESSHDNDPIIDFICKIPDAVDTEYNRKDIPNTVNLFYSKVNYILKGFAINSGLFSVKPMPQEMHTC
jgi:hypothetical protein